MWSVVLLVGAIGALFFVIWATMKQYDDWEE